MSFEEWYIQNKSKLYDYRLATEYVSGKKAAKEIYDSLQPQWLPIETAPKDKIVLVLYKDGHATSISSSAALEWVEEKEKYGLVVNDWEIPTYWMPLPELPNNE